MTLRTLYVYNGSIHGCLSFNFPDSQQLYNSADPHEALVPLGWMLCKAVANAALPSCGCHTELPRPPSPVPSLVTASKAPTCFVSPACWVVNHQWIGSSVFLYLKQPWTWMNASLRRHKMLKAQGHIKSSPSARDSFVLLLLTLPFEPFSFWAGLELG